MEIYIEEHSDNKDNNYTPKTIKLEDEVLRFYETLDERIPENFEYKYTILSKVALESIDNLRDLILVLETEREDIKEVMKSGVTICYDKNNFYGIDISNNYTKAYQLYKKENKKFFSKKNLFLKLKNIQEIKEEEELYFKIYVPKFYNIDDIDILKVLSIQLGIIRNFFIKVKNKIPSITKKAEKLGEITSDEIKTFKEMSDEEFQNFMRCF